MFSSACFAEKEGTFSNTERCVRRVRRAVEAPGQSKDDWWTLCEVATRMGYAMQYPDSQAIFKELATVTPSYAGLSYGRIEEEGTVFIPFHYAQAAANKLTNAALDPISGIPEFKVSAVKIDKAA